MCPPPVSSSRGHSKRRGRSWLSQLVPVFGERLPEGVKAIDGIVKGEGLVTTASEQMHKQPIVARMGLCGAFQLAQEVLWDLASIDTQNEITHDRQGQVLGLAIHRGVPLSLHALVLHQDMSRRSKQRRMV